MTTKGQQISTCLRMLRILFAIASCVIVTFPIKSYAKSKKSIKTHQPLYQNPFDLAGGGASLTKATQDGVPFSNPSLLSFGRGDLRWIWGRAGIHGGARPFSLLRNSKESQGNTADALNGKSGWVHGGVDANSGFLNRNGGLTMFSTMRSDAETVKEDGKEKTSVQSVSYAYMGTVFTGAFSIKDTLGIGFNVRPMLGAEASTLISPEEIEAQRPAKETFKEDLQYGGGVGYDGALTFQRRSKTFDTRLAVVTTDIGNTKFSGGKLPTWLQTYHVGLGLTWHNRDDALHCATDVRDVGAQYSEGLNKKIYMGCKALWANRIGLAGGLSNMKGTYGLILNLYIVRLEAGSYSRALSTEFGRKLRRVYFLAIGMEIP